MATLSAQIKLLPATACATSGPVFQTCVYATVIQEEGKMHLFTSYVLKLVSEAKGWQTVHICRSQQIAVAAGCSGRVGGSFCMTSSTLEAWLRGADAPRKQVQKSARRTDGESPEGVSLFLPQTSPSPLFEPLHWMSSRGTREQLWFEFAKARLRLLFFRSDSREADWCY